MQKQTSSILPIAKCQSPIVNDLRADLRTRLPWLDFASGIMILWMITYHTLMAVWYFDLNEYWDITDSSLLPGSLHRFVNDEGKLEVMDPCTIFPWLHFFMPWFFYKSGQFFRKRSVKELWKKDWNKLMKTFILWSLIGYGFYILLSLLNDTLTLRRVTYSVVRGCFLHGSIPINGPCWFLLTLFGVRFVANKLLPEKDDKYATWKILSIVAVGYVISFLAYRFNYRLLPYWVVNGAAGLSFFALGYALRDWEQKWWVIVPCMVVYVLGCFVGFPTVSMLSNTLLSGIYHLWIPVALCSIVFFNNLCKWLYSFVRIIPIEWIGKNAMMILLVHTLIYVPIKDICTYFNVSISGNELLCIILFAYGLVLPLCALIRLSYNKMFKKSYQYNE